MRIGGLAQCFGGLALIVLLGLALLPARPQDQPGGGKAPGFRLTLESGGVRDVRSSRLVSLYVPAGDTPSPLFSPGPFKAIWEGDLSLDLKDEMTFSAEGRGKLTVVVNGQTVLDLTGDNFAKSSGKPIELKRGANALIVRYESPAQGDAQIRLFWASSAFYREPLSASLAKHDATEKELVAADRFREGRNLVATLHCLKCHASNVKPAMPELAADAPSLADLGARVNEAWLARWIQDPQGLRPTATMPRLFPASEKGIDPRARDIAAYLSTLGKVDEKSAKAAEDETANAGGRLFVHLGCFTCHLPPNKDELVDDDHRRIPLRFVGAKWKPAALKQFLLQPAKHYRWIRMPNFHLSEDEVTKLTAYLLRPEKMDMTVPGPKGDPERGRQLLGSTGCLNCHSVTANQPPTAPLKAVALPTLPKENWSRGCMDPKRNAERKAPDFALGADQRVALAEFAVRGWPTLVRDSAVDFTSRQMKQLRCNACHKRDEQDDVWTDLREEAGSLLADNPGEDEEKDPSGQAYPAEQKRPPLTWTGEKLKPEWTTAFLAGEVRYKPRPYLRARMPTFSRDAAFLARGLALEHGCPPRSPADAKPDEKLAEAGWRLSGKKAWGCAGCHNVGSTVAVSAFEAPGPNFSTIKERLRRDYFDRWLWSPTRVEPGTKMPALFMIGKPSLLTEELGGDPNKQIDAFWNYLLTGDKIKHPDP